MKDKLYDLNIQRKSIWQDLLPTYDNSQQKGHTRNAPQHKGYIQQENC